MSCTATPTRYRGTDQHPTPAPDAASRMPRRSALLGHRPARHPLLRSASSPEPLYDRGPTDARRDLPTAVPKHIGVLAGGRHVGRRDCFTSPDDDCHLGKALTSSPRRRKQLRSIVGHSSRRRTPLSRGSRLLPRVPTAGSCRGCLAVSQPVSFRKQISEPARVA